MKDAWKLLGIWVVFALSLVVGGIAARILHLSLDSPGHKLPVHFIAVLIAGAVLVLGLMPLARGLAGSNGARAAVIAVFLFLALGVNTLIEASVFSTVVQGVVPGQLVVYLMQALLVGCALGWSFGATGKGTGFRSATPADWLGRGLLAWIGWPVTYLLFGMCVAPFVMPYYHSLDWLRIPTMNTVIETQLVRSVIFAACSLPAIALWKGSRRGLWGALGLAHAVTVGGYGLISGTFLPVVLRLCHSLEITGDSFAYSGLLVLLFSGASGMSSVRRAPQREVVQREGTRVAG